MVDKEQEAMQLSELGINTGKVASIVTFGKVISLIIGLITFVIVARLLGPVNYGIFTIALSVAGFVGAISSVGSYLNKYIPELLQKKQKEKIGMTIGDSLLMLALVGVFLFILGVILAGSILVYLFHNHGTMNILYVALISMFLSLLYTTVYAALISFGDGKQSTIMSIMYYIAQAIVSITLVWMGYGATGAVLGYATGLFVSTVFGLFYLQKHTKIRIQLEGMLKRLPQLVNFSIPLTGSNVINNLSKNFGVLFLGTLFLPNIVGAYGIADKSSAFVEVVLGSIMIVLIPMFSTAAKMGKENIGKLYYSSLYFGLLFAMPLLAYLAVFSQQIVTVFFTTSYTNAALYIFLINLGLIVGIAGVYASSVLISMGKVKKILKYSLIIAIVQTIALLALVPFMAALGVIIALYFVNSIVSNYLYYGYLKHEMGIHINMSRIYRLVAANILLTLLAAPLYYASIGPKTQLVLGFVVIMLLYPLVLGIFKAASGSDIQIFEGVGKNMPILNGIFKLVTTYSRIFIRN